MTRIIAIHNQKGGVGKTTLAFNLAGAISAAGQSCLLVDADHQGSLTKGILSPDAAKAFDADRTLAAVFGPASPTWGQLMIRDVFPGVDLIPAHLDMEGINTPLPWSLPLDRQLVLRTFLRIDPKHDWVITDTHPDAGLPSWAAMVAADYWLIPVQAENYSAMSIADVMDTLGLVARINPDGRLIGLVAGLFQAQTVLHRDFMEAIRARYEDLVFAATLPHSTVFPTAVSRGKPVPFVFPRSVGAEAVSRVFAELVARVESIEAIASQARGGSRVG